MLYLPLTLPICKYTHIDHINAWSRRLKVGSWRGEEVTSGRLIYLVYLPPFGAKTKTGSHLASQTKVPGGGSCRIYKVTSPMSINPGSDMTSWSHAGWVVVDEPGGYRGVRTSRQGRACRGRTGQILKPLSSLQHCCWLNKNDHRLMELSIYSCLPPPSWKLCQ